MKDNKNQSFEMVDLISPIDLAPIQGIASPFETKDDDITIPLENPEKKIATPEPVKKQAIEDEFKDYDEIDQTQGRYQGTDKMFNPFQEDAWRTYQYNNDASGDPLRFYREEEALKKKLENSRRLKKGVFITAIIFGLLMMVIVILIRRYVSNNFLEVNYNSWIEDVEAEPVEDNKVIMNDYLGQPDVYGTLELDTEKLPATDLVEISPEVIEFTGMYERSLYFKITPQKDKVVFEVYVEMIDKYGNSYGKVYGYTDKVPKGKTIFRKVFHGQ